MWALVLFSTGILFDLENEMNKWDCEILILKIIFKKLLMWYFVERTTVKFSLPAHSNLWSFALLRLQTGRYLGYKGLDDVLIS